MTEKIRVGDVMTRNFINLKSDCSIIDCARTMIKKRVGSIVIKEGDEIKGILTEKDIVWALSKKKGRDLNEIQAKDIATKKIISIRPEASLDEAFQKMKKKKVRRLPVMSNKKIIGYITQKDMLRFRPALLESIKESGRIREEWGKIKRSKSAIKGEFIEAPCEDCGNFDILEEIDGQMLCEPCKEAM